jgi:hypothetical protein
VHVTGECCGTCDVIPCNWTKYRRRIILHLKNNYVGFYMDVDDNVISQQLDSATGITIKQLHYLAYSAFTASKHGYLGKNKCIPCPFV